MDSLYDDYKGWRFLELHHNLDGFISMTWISKAELNRDIDFNKCFMITGEDILEIVFKAHKIIDIYEEDTRAA